MSRCGAHDWMTPSVGDEGLRCESCGRFVPFAGALHPGLRRDIVRGRMRRDGPEAGEAFARALDDAYAARLDQFPP